VAGQKHGHVVNERPLGRKSAKSTRNTFILSVSIQGTWSNKGGYPSGKSQISMGIFFFIIVTHRKDYLQIFSCYHP